MQKSRSMRGRQKRQQIPFIPNLEKRFWEAPDEALFTRPEVAQIRRCSRAKLDRECWLGCGVPVIRDCGRVLYRKSDIVKHLSGLSAGEVTP